MRLPLIRAARRALRHPRAVTLGLTIRATDGTGRAAAPVSRSVTLRRR